MKLAGFEVHTAMNEGAADFCLLKNVRTGPEAHPTSFQWVSGFVPAGQAAGA